MPRKAWIPKNRYCRNTNLSEALFVRLLRLYCAGFSCSYAARILARHARHFGAEKISRQSANRYFLLFGERLYGLLPDSLREGDPDLSIPLAAADTIDADQLEPKSLYLRIAHAVLYEKYLRADRFNETLIGRETYPLHDMLKELSRSRRGFPVETFAAPFAFVAWALILIEQYPAQPLRKSLFDLMKAELESRPLNAYSRRSPRLAKLEPLEKMKAEGWVN